MVKNLIFKNEGTAVDVGTSPRDNVQSQVGSSPIDSAVSNTSSTLLTLMMLRNLIALLQHLR